MVKLLHKLTGTVMYVSDERKDEYLKAGHKLADEQKKARKKATADVRNSK